MDAAPTTVVQCQSTSSTPGNAEAIEFRLTSNGSTPTSASATVTLPAGLAWADGSTTNPRSVAAVNGLVTLPAITPTGASGTYTVTVVPL